MGFCSDSDFGRDLALCFSSAAIFAKRAHQVVSQHLAGLGIRTPSDNPHGLGLLFASSSTGKLSVGDAAPSYRSGAGRACCSWTYGASSGSRTQLCAAWKAGDTTRVLRCGNDKGHALLQGMALDTCSPHGRQAGCWCRGPSPRTGCQGFHLHPFEPLTPNPKTA